MQTDDELLEKFLINADHVVSQKVQSLQGYFCKQYISFIDEKDIVEGANQFTQLPSENESIFHTCCSSCGTAYGPGTSTLRIKSKYKNSQKPETNNKELKTTLIKQKRKRKKQGCLVEVICLTCNKIKLTKCKKNTKRIKNVYTKSDKIKLPRTPNSSFVKYESVVYKELPKTPVTVTRQYQSPVTPRIVPQVTPKMKHTVTDLEKSVGSSSGHKRNKRGKNLSSLLGVKKSANKPSLLSFLSSI